MKLSKKRLKEYKEFLAEENPLCQVCGEKPPEDLHHLYFGCYGADKDDRFLIAVCRDCHEWLHKNKHLGQEKYEDIVWKNWVSYDA